MGMASMRKWIRRYGSIELARHARLRERRRREFMRRDSARIFLSSASIDGTIIDPPVIKS